MTVQTFIERKRNAKGKYVQTTPDGWKKKSGVYTKAYLAKNPWAKYWTYSKSRAHTRKIEHTVTVQYFKLLWKRDKAHLMSRPSIDRIDPKKGYIYGNCRFLELKTNISIGNKGIKRFRKCPSCGWEPKTI